MNQEPPQKSQRSWNFRKVNGDFDEHLSFFTQLIQDAALRKTYQDLEELCHYSHILKPGKAATSYKNYRAISLTCIICKLTERIMHTRLMQWIMKNNALHFYQTAYRAKHSTVEKLFYLCQSVINGFQEKPHKKTTMVLIDLCDAFYRESMETYTDQHRSCNRHIIKRSDLDK
ncbi:hypothetical protein TNIN_43591 [Trichonephila inaurata madagascariensis]|uniref:Reverse transcriptase domain-containing protein n=1 Tax=Trichonephila inaurata madagascariensis TaxID=2747483 RepID=A0A8X6XZ43_9ARAC|nr:hypothetical protein TNIN_43591 [Trichonephila inaurata madagascariensis]